MKGSSSIRISVVVLNYNGAPWIERCLTSLRSQTLGDEIEVLVADNASTDGSDRTAEELLTDWPRGTFLPNGGNLGFCEGNNRAARQAQGSWLFFLNNDTWLEPDCLERLVNEAEAQHATAATPLVMNLDDDAYQWVFAAGFDLFGLPSFRVPPRGTSPLFMPPGCSYLIRREAFVALGEFDASLFMYADELDLSWRVWLSGGEALVVPSARLHHRGAAQVNPEGGDKVVELRTSDTKRYYANRNNLLVLLKNAQHLLLLLAVTQVLLLVLEAVVGLILVRRWSFVRRAYVDALFDCWRQRHHILAERRHIRGLRRRGDVWMLRFLRWRPNRLDELQRILHLGLPKVTRG